MITPPAYWNDLTDDERAAMRGAGPLLWDYATEPEWRAACAAFDAARPDPSDDAEAVDHAAPGQSAAAPSPTPYTPDPASRRYDGWTAERQRSFLECLAEGHSVESACRVVGMTHQSAYAFRRRASGAAFALGWNAALLLARQKLADTLYVRAIEGFTETVTKANGDVIERHRFDNRLATVMLARLDRLAEANAQETTHAAARIAAQDFDAFLDMVETADPAAARDFIATRTEPAEPAPEENAPDPQLPQLRPGEDAEHADNPPVWYCDIVGQWRTRFPAPQGFDDIEEGEYGDPDYARALTLEELTALATQYEAELDAQRAQEEDARTRWLAAPWHGVRKVRWPSLAQDEPLIRYAAPEDIEAAIAGISEDDQGSGRDAAVEELC